MTDPWKRREVIGDATLYLGDCLEILPTLDKVDAVITDPPFSTVTAAGARTRHDGTHSGDNLVPFSISAETLREAFTLAAPKRWLVATIDWRHAGQFAESPPDGLRFIRGGAWVKLNSAPQFTGDRPAPGWEFVIIMHGPEKMRWNGKGKRAVWQTIVEAQNGHPTPKPEKLMREWLGDFTDAGETILDPFMGSGTTGVACANLGRKFIGIEIEEKYFNIAVERITNAYRQQRMFA